MTDTPDAALLDQFARNGSEEAFTEIVRRHVGLVHSVARRQTQNAQYAEEITQAVFIILARKAASLGSNTILSGWLYHTARLTTANFQRAEVRRVHREQKALMQPQSHDEQTESAWQDMGPLLEKAMSKLKTTDRDALVLRFFENKSLREVGTAMGMEERAAQKRVARGLEKLRAFFTKRGVVLSTAIIAGAVSANSVQAAPIGLVTTVATSAITKGSILSTPIALLINGTLKTMKWTTIKLSAGLGVTALVLAAAAVKVTLNNNVHDARAMEILKQVRLKYAALSSYDSAGQAIETIDGKVLTTTFTMRLGRSNLYRFEYEQHGLTLTNKGAAWSQGNGDYFANDVVGQTTRIPIAGPGHNLGDLWDISGGAPLIVPALFFETPIPADLSSAGKLNLVFGAMNPSKETVVMQPDQQIDGIDCHVILLKTDDETETIWVGKTDALIHQSQEAIKSKVDDMTDAEADQMLAGIPGNSNLPKIILKQRMNQARKEAAKTGKSVTVYFPENKGKNGIQSATAEPPPVFVFTQTHSNIALNQPFSPQDFTRLK